MAATNYSQEVKKDTKDFITIATLKILKKKKLSVVTVSQICNVAGVSRMAFYRNFDSIEDVLYEYYQNKITLLFKNLNTSNDMLKFEYQDTFFNAFGDILKLATENGSEPIIKDIFIQEIEQYYTTSNDEYWIAFISSGVYAIWRKWLLEGRKKPLIEIIGFLKNIDSIKNNL